MPTASRTTTRSSCPRRWRPPTSACKARRLSTARWCRPRRLASKDLDAYAAVCVVDPRPLDAAVWQKLHSYVAAGGGLGIVLGAQRQRPWIRSTLPLRRSCLPGQLVRQWRRRDARTWRRGLSASGPGEVSLAGSRLGAVAGVSSLAVGRSDRGDRGGVCLFRQSAGAARTARRPRASADADHADLRPHQAPRSLEPTADRRRAGRS